MKKMDNITFEKLSWKDVRTSVSKVNSKLCKLIDELDPPYTIFKGTYPFGTEVMKNGFLQLPDETGRLYPIIDSKIKDSMRDSLNYNLGSNPVSLLLKNTAELFVKFENRIIPLYGLITPGKIFGLWRVLGQDPSHNPTFLWSMTAGARSLIMLPKISEIASYKKLQRELNIHVEIPQSLLDHWRVFKAIARHEEFTGPWNTEIIFFSKEWFSHLNDKKWIYFKNYLLQTAWDGSEFRRNQFMWNMVFSFIREKKRIKADPYLIDTVKHLLALGVGAVPGFAPAIDDSAGPIAKIQQAFVEHYGLRYAPIIMQPNFFSESSGYRPVYDSLQYPTTVEFSPKYRALSSKIVDTYHISNLTHKFLSELRSSRLNLESTPFYDLMQRACFDFFHTDVERYQTIRPSQEIPQEDTSFLSPKYCQNLPFPYRNPFVRGCIRVSIKNEHKEL